MSTLHRNIRDQRRRGEELLKAAYRDELGQAGSARQAALEQAEAQLDRIGRLLPGATQAGLSMAEVARLAGVSRPTLYELLKGSGAKADPTVAVLASLVSAPQTVSEIVTALDLSAKALSPILDVLCETGWIEKLEPSDAGVAPAYAATQTGEQSLARWEFSDPFEEHTTKTLRVMLGLMHFTPDERARVEKKVARAQAQGKERLGLLEAMRMGIESELKRLQANRKRAEPGP